MLIGLSIAAPVGPIGVLCIRRTLAYGRTIGLISGLGAATADATYGFIAAFGFTLLTDFLISGRGVLSVLGGAFLVYLGVTTFRTAPTHTTDPAAGTPPERVSAWGAYGSTFVLTLTNPATILAFIAIFAGFGLAQRASGGLPAVVTVLGVFFGSALWWLVLSITVSAARRFAGAGFMRWVNRLSGVVLVIFGLLALFSAVR